jgi:hypothetical protein
VKDAVGPGAMTAARCLVRPGEREAGGSSQRDRPDRLLDTRRCYIRFRQHRGSCERVPVRSLRNCNITALVSGSRKHSFMTVPNGAKPFCAHGSSGSYPGAWWKAAGAKGCGGERRPLFAMGLADQLFSARVRPVLRRRRAV